MQRGQEAFSDAKQGDQGPSWHEVLRYWDDLSREHGHVLTLAAQVVQDSKGVYGVRGVFGCLCSDQPYGSFSYGRAYADSAKTLPAALYRCLLAVDEVLKARKEEKERDWNAWLNGDPT